MTRLQVRGEPRDGVARLAVERRASEPVAPRKSLISRTSGTRTQEAPNANRPSRWAYVFRARSIAFATVLSLIPSARAIVLSLRPSSRRCLALSASFR
jgi:hypothetical protein